MSVFESYAHYYDDLYADKDYAGEAAYVARLLASFGCPAGHLLELGCGTGRHAVELARRRFFVTGVDASRVMLAAARDRARRQDGTIRRRLRFLTADIRDLQLGETFDGVVALFHVLDYSTDNLTVQRWFATVRRHLRCGGVCLFDIWYGPAVLTQRPRRRVRRIHRRGRTLCRITEPSWEVNRNVVDVAFHLTVRESGRREPVRITEHHPMRYFFLPELEAFVEGAGLHLDHAEEWMTGRPPGLDTWSVCVVARG